MDTDGASFSWVAVTVPAIAALASAVLTSLFHQMTSRDERAHVERVQRIERESADARHRRELEMRRRELLAEVVKPLWQARLADYPDLMALLDEIRDKLLRAKLADRDFEAVRRTAIEKYLTWEPRYSLLVAPDTHLAINAFGEYIRSHTVDAFVPSDFEACARAALGALQAEIQFSSLADDPTYQELFAPFKE